MRQMILEIFHFKVMDLRKMDINISQIFSLVQDIEKIKVQYFKSLLFVLFEVLKAVKVNKQISLDFKFCCYGQSNENN